MAETFIPTSSIRLNRRPSQIPFEQKPDWLKVKATLGPNFTDLKALNRDLSLHTICEEARCPNIYECWENRTATFLILGRICTRACRFCAVETGRPTELDLEEPDRVAQAVRHLRLRHVVITSVARDDLADGGACVFADTIRAIRRDVPDCSVEVLIPDLQGSDEGLAAIVAAGPEILNHNVETVERLQKPVRVQARYDRSRFVLRHAKSRGFTTKSGIMLGVGERKDEIAQTLHDLRGDGVEILTIGQYLQPTSRHLPVDRWVTPEEFREWKEFGLSIGFGVIESGPLVRSSYHADEQSARYADVGAPRNAVAS